MNETDEKEIGDMLIGANARLKADFEKVMTTILELGGDTRSYMMLRLLEKNMPQLKESVKGIIDANEESDMKFYDMIVDGFKVEMIAVKITKKDE